MYPRNTKNKNFMKVIGSSLIEGIKLDHQGEVQFDSAKIN